MNIDTIGKPEEFPSRTPLQIRFSDVDVLGHVNNTVYMAFYDTGKAMFFSQILGRDIDWKRVETVIANVDVAFRQPVYFRDRIEVLTRCKTIGEKSFRLEQVILDADTGEVKSACETVMVAFNPATATSEELPDHWREALERSMSKHQ